MHKHMVAGSSRWFALLIKALGIVYSGLCPAMVFAGPNAGIIETVTAPDGLYLAAFGAYESYVPLAMAFDPLGRLHIADRTVIYRMERDGSATLIVGFPQTGGEPKSNVLVDSIRALDARIVPGAMTFDRAGRLYFVDYINLEGARIARLDLNGRLATFAGTGEFGYSGDGGDARQAQFAFRVRSVRWSSLVFDREDNLLILDYGNGRIRKIDPAGKVTTLLDTTTKDAHGVPIGDTGRLLGELDHDREGNLYFCTSRRVFRRRLDGTIEAIAGSGEKGFSGDGGPALSAALSFPSGLAVGRDGQVYFSDWNNNRIRRVSRSGIIETIAGNGQETFELPLSELGDGGMAVNAIIWWPERLLFTPEGDLLVAMLDHAFSDGPLFSVLRRICKVDEWLPTAVAASFLSDMPLEKASSLSVFPNPFNAETFIRFDLAIRSAVDLTIYNINGQAVRRLIAGEHQAPGQYTATWDGRDDEGRALASGAYLIVLDNGQRKHTQKMTLAR